MLKIQIYANKFTHRFPIKTDYHLQPLLPATHPTHCFLTYSDHASDFLTFLNTISFCHQHDQSSNRCILVASLYFFVMHFTKWPTMFQFLSQYFSELSATFDLDPWNNEAFCSTLSHYFLTVSFLIFILVFSIHFEVSSVIFFSSALVFIHYFGVCSSSIYSLLFSKLVSFISIHLLSSWLSLCIYFQESNKTLQLEF